MNKIIFCIAMIIIAITSNANADIYKWTDKDGTINYGDTPPASEDKNYEIIRKEIPKSSPPTRRIRKSFPLPPKSGTNNYQKTDKDKIEVHKNSTTDNIKSNYEAEKQLMSTAENLLPPNNNLSDRSKGWVVNMLLDGNDPSDLKEALKNVKTDEDMNEILEYMAMVEFKLKLDVIGETNSAFASPELTWSKYKDSLMRGDIESALKCLSPTLAYKHRQMFRNLKKENIISLGTNMNKVSKISIEGSKAKYRIYRMQNGKDITNYVYFVKLNGNWKISLI